MGVRRASNPSACVSSFFVFGIVGLVRFFVANFRVEMRNMTVVNIHFFRVSQSGNSSASVASAAAPKDIVVRVLDESGRLVHLNIYNAAFDPLNFVLLYPHGRPGWCPGLPHDTNPVWGLFTKLMDTSGVVACFSFGLRILIWSASTEYKRWKRSLVPPLPKSCLVVSSTASHLGSRSRHRRCAPTSEAPESSS